MSDPSVKRGTIGRTARSFGTAICGFLLITQILLPTVSALASGSPTLATDAQDYTPGSTVTLSGAGWQAAEAVHLFVNDDKGQSWSWSDDVTADDSGAFTEQFTLPNWFVATYIATATGSVSGTATTSFTDGNVKVDSGSPATASSFVITSTTYLGSSDCSTGAQTPTSTTVTNNNFTQGVGSSDSVKLQASATADSGAKRFSAWSSTDSPPSPFTDLRSGTICVPGFQSSQRNYRVTYVTNNSPVVAAPANQNGTAGTAKSFNIESFTDDGPSPWAVDVNWGDASSHTTLSSSSTGSLGTASHTYAAVGTFTVTVTVTDGAGTGRSGSRTFSIVVASGDTTPPSGTVSINGGAGFTNSATVTLHLHATDNVGVTAYRVANGSDCSGATYQSVTSIATFDLDITNWALPAGDGSKTVCAQYRDAALNQSATATASITLDTQAPDTTITANPSNPTNNTSASFSFTGSDNITPPASLTFECQLDGNGFTSCTSPKSYAGPLSPGTHTFMVRAKDQAGNTDATPASFTWTVDTTAPTVTILSAATPTTGGSSVTWNATKSGPYSVRVGGSDCSSGTLADSGTYTAPGNVTSAIASNALAEGSNSVRVCVTDAAANTGSATTTVVKNTTTTLTESNATGTYGGSVDLSATLKNGTSPVAGATISFKLQGTPVGSATTDSSGEAVLIGASLDGIAAGTHAGGITATFAGDGTFQGSSGSADLSVAKADPSCSVTPYDVTYDTHAHTATGSCTGAKGETLSGLNLSGTTHTNAGTFTDSWTFTDATGNYNDASGVVSDHIGKTDATCTVTGYTGVYDGGSHGATGSCSGVGGENAGTLDLGQSFTNVPGGTAHWTFTGNGNYKDQAGDVAVSISKADPSCAVNGYSVTYDGAAHTATGTCVGVGGPSDVLAGLDLSGTKHTHAGTYAGDPWTFTDTTGNYKDAADTVTDQIDKADASCSISGYSGTYDGAAHGATGTCSGVGGEDAGTLSLGASFTNVPGGTAHWTFTGNGNYKDQAGDVAVSISKADPSCAVNGYSVTYDGAAHTATGTCVGVGGPSDVLAGLDLSGTKHTHAGTYSDSWTFTDSTGNYKGAAGTVTDTIEKADPTCSVTPYSVTFDGNAHTATGGCKGVKSEALSGLDLSGTTHTNPGTYNADPWTFTDATGNYKGASGTAKDAILYSTGSCLGSPGHAVLQPVNPDGSSVFKQGSTVPVKFRVCDASGNSIGTPGVVTGSGAPVLVSKTDGAGGVDEAIYSTTPDTAFRWDPTAQQWIFNQSTKNLKSGTVYTYAINLNDGGPPIIYVLGVK